jgi:hypothetical protein
MPEDRAVDLSPSSVLTEIRDLLVVLVEASLPAYAEVVRRRLGSRADELVGLVNTDKQWAGLRLCQGDTAQRAIARSVGMDPGDMSRFVGRLRDAGFIEDTKKGPRSSLSPHEIDAVRWNRS